MGWGRGHRGRGDGEGVGHEIVVGEMEGGDREIRGGTVSSKDEIQLVASFVSRRRRREVKIKG